MSQTREIENHRKLDQLRLEIKNLRTKIKDFRIKDKSKSPTRNSKYLENLKSKNYLNSEQFIHLISDVKSKNQELQAELNKQQIKVSKLAINLDYLLQFMPHGSNRIIKHYFKDNTQKWAFQPQKNLVYPKESENDLSNVTKDMVENPTAVEALSSLVIINLLIETNSKLSKMNQQILGEYLKVKQILFNFQNNIDQTKKTGMKRSYSSNTDKINHLKNQQKESPLEFPSKTQSKMYLRKIHVDFNNSIEEMICDLIYNNKHISDIGCTRKYSKRNYILTRSLTCLK